MLLHLQDSFTFWNELVKTQATSQDECDVFEEYNEKYKTSQRKYGRGAVMTVFMPYMYACAKYRGYIWKGLTFYMFLNCMNAIYDCGMYARFFVYGP